MSHNHSCPWVMNVLSGAYQPQLSRDRVKHVFRLHHLALRCVFGYPSRLIKLPDRRGRVNTHLSQADLEAPQPGGIGPGIINVHYPPRVRAKQMSADSGRPSTPRLAPSTPQPGPQFDGRNSEFRGPGLALLDA